MMADHPKPNDMPSGERTLSPVQLIVLGSGSGVPNPDRRPSGYVLQTPRAAVLVDLGPGAWHTAARYVQPKDIRAVLLTHPHIDHALDTLTLIFSLALIPTQDHRIPIIGSPGCLDIVRKWVRAVNHLDPERVDWLETLPGRSFDLGKDFVLTTGLARHTPESLAYRVRTGPWSFTFTGDTGWSDDVLQLAKHTDAFVVDCSHRNPSRYHLDLQGALAMARLAGSRLTVLSHFYPDGLKVFPKPPHRLPNRLVIRATDGLTLTWSQ